MKFILKEILKIDKELILVSNKLPEININKEGWKEKLKLNVEEEKQDKIKIVKSLQMLLLDSFENFNLEERIQIWEAISKTKKLRFDFLIHKEELLLEIIMNLEPDPRDAMIRLNFMLEKLDNSKISIVKNILKIFR
ncbi:hypothetical protein [Aureivirga marina]|uniref:hypothetical protein n=1 Tax=Aureivirga marina TaxID=1182451 RepID=UPI0018C94AFC|nr:hypothetical protein [Aureivirga marina]